MAGDARRLFQHSNDSRTSAQQSRSQQPRVGFGEGWLKDSVIEFFEGLRQSGIEGADIELYLGALEERVRSGQTGAQWMPQSLEAMGEEGTSDLRQRKLAAAILERQQGVEPVHRWEVIKAYGSEGWRVSPQTVGNLMSTDLFTARPVRPFPDAAEVTTCPSRRPPHRTARRAFHLPVSRKRGLRS